MLYISISWSAVIIKWFFWINFIRSSIAKVNGNGPWMYTTKKTPYDGYFEIIYFFLVITDLLNGKWKQIEKVY